MYILDINVPGDTKRKKESEVTMCNFPNYMIPVGTHIDKNMNEKITYKFLGYHQWKQIMKTLKDPMAYIEVPCGKCLECRIQRTRQWADRCVLEAKQYKYNYFVTLTYDDNHLPIKNSLDSKDLQLFMKRLRKKFKGIKIRFLACGEYGDISWRPHYHLLLFNCPIPDLSYVFMHRDVVDIDLTTGKNIYGPYQNDLRPPKAHSDLMFSKTIYDLWQYKGFISVGPVNYDTAAYVAQYINKKLDGAGSKLYDELGIIPPFLRMSNRPGIGANYLAEHDNVHDDDHIIVPGDGIAHVASVPRYYDKLFIKKYGDDVFDPIRIRRNRKKLQNVGTILHDSSKDLDRERKLKDYNLNKRKKIREQI